MAHFYATIQGGNGEQTCTGTKKSGLIAHVRGWNIGAQVRLEHIDGKDVVTVVRTVGSKGEVKFKQKTVIFKEGE